MPKKATLEKKTVAELREMAADKEIEGRSGMAKDDLIDTLATDASSSKGEKRLFQLGDDPARKEWLTQDQAKEKGLYWNPDPDSVNSGRQPPNV